MQNSCLLWLDIQSGKVSFLGLLSFGLKDPLRAMLFQSIYVQVPSIRLSEGSALGGRACWMKITHPTARRRRLFLAPPSGERTLQEQSNVCGVMICDESRLRVVWRTPRRGGSGDSPSPVNRRQMFNYTTRKADGGRLEAGTCGGRSGLRRMRRFLGDRGGRNCDTIVVYPGPITLSLGIIQKEMMCAKSNRVRVSSRPVIWGDGRLQSHISTTTVDLVSTKRRTY